MAEDRYAIWGSSGHARVLSALIALRGGRVIASFDNDPRAVGLSGVPLYIGQPGFEQWLATLGAPDEILGLVAIGGSRGRERVAIQTMFEQRGLPPGVIVHPTAAVCATASLGVGSQVLAQAVVAAEARLGRSCIVNHLASVDHECVLGDGVHVAPGATLCGCIVVGDHAFIGAGAVVLPRLSIGEDALIGAGAVVTHDVPAGAQMAGNPARIIQGKRDV